MTLLQWDLMDVSGQVWWGEVGVGVGGVRWLGADESIQYTCVCESMTSAHNIHCLL